MNRPTRAWATSFELFSTKKKQGRGNYLFPHLFLPDLVEAHIAQFGLQPAETKHEEVLVPHRRFFEYANLSTGSRLCGELEPALQENQENDQDKIQCHYRSTPGRVILVRCPQPRARDSERFSRTVLFYD